MQSVISARGTLALAVILALLPARSDALQDESRNPLLGAWEVQEVHWKHAEKPYSIDDAQPGLFIFEANRYAVMWVPTKLPRTPFKVLSQPSDAEAIAGFKSVVFNGGSYEYTPSTVTTIASIAKVPGFEGGKQFYRFQIDGNVMRLTMFDEQYPDGSRPDWAGEYETEFVLRKVD